MINNQILKDRWFVWALASIIIAGSSLLGYLEYSKTEMGTESAENEINSLHQKFLSSRNEISGPASSEVEGWQTYRNEKYSLELKHPTDWVIRKNTGESWDISWEGKLNEIPYILDLGYVSQNTLNLIGISYCEANLEDPRCENFKWNNLTALIDWDIETEGAFTQSRAEIRHPDGGVIIISIYHRPTQDIKSFFHQILSTFRFIK